MANGKKYDIWLGLVGGALIGAFAGYEIGVKHVTEQTQHEIVQRDLPVGVTFEKPPSPSNPIVNLHNFGESELFVTVTAKSPKTKLQSAWTFVLLPNKATEIGEKQGWNFADGDELLIEQNGYRPITFLVGH